MLVNTIPIHMIQKDLFIKPYPVVCLKYVSNLRNYFESNTSQN